MLADWADDPGRDGPQAVRRLSGVTPTSVKWLWYGWLPLGKVSILEGDSDVGKSTVTLSWAAIVSQGKPWPTSVVGTKHVDSISDPADVVLVGIEDDEDDTVVPRLMAAGADLERIATLNRPVDEWGDPKPFTIPDDIDWLRQGIVETGAKLVVIDPISACMPENVKHGVDTSIRRVLMHLVELARETQCAILLVRHFNKAAGMSAKHRGGGSVAYSALVRSVISAAPLLHPTDEGATYALARAIGNLSKAPSSIGYSLDSSADNEEVPEVTWRGTVDVTADQLIGADGAKVADARKTAPLREAAKVALKELLSHGPLPSDEAIEKTQLASGAGKGTVQSAAKDLAVIKISHYGDSGAISHWTWELPPGLQRVKQAGDVEF
ncbi:AAA family ATPase [Mycolicibacterium stellerae]|uniref:AAA family ATPase n=1 Tax=Mycolicibacterium stellerae TaxID=2358193 RepID=UPI000F0B67FC|nr:AAA family ATPase [Mycolicibacterium stellerae]